MKAKKKLSTVLALCITLLLTACAGKETTEPESTPNAAATADTAQAADGADAKLDDLYQQENQLFAKFDSPFTFRLVSAPSSQCSSLRFFMLRRSRLFRDLLPSR